MTFRSLEKRLERLEAATHTDGERPPELSKEEKDILDNCFDVDPWGDR